MITGLHLTKPTSLPAKSAITRAIMIMAPVPMNIGSARYYDSRIGNWISVDPLFEKHYDYSPYNYVLRKPTIMYDPDGKQVKFDAQFLKTQAFSQLMGELNEFSGLSLWVDQEGFLELKSHVVDNNSSAIAREVVQKMLNVPKWDLKVYSSNTEGSFGGDYINLNPDQIQEFINGARNVDSRTLGWAMVLIHEFLHTKYGMNFAHPKLPFGETDKLIDKMNDIREELEAALGGEWGREQSHIALQMGDYNYYLPMSTTARDMMKFSRMSPEEHDLFIMSARGFNY